MLPQTQVKIKKKVFIANWFCFSPEFRNFDPNSGEDQKKGLRRSLVLSRYGNSDFLFTA